MSASISSRASFGRLRMREEEALDEVAAEVAEDLDLLAGLDTLGDDVEPERLRHLHDRVDDRGLLLARGPSPSTNERSIFRKSSRKRCR